MHMYVTGFSTATIFVFAIASPLHAQGVEVFAGYSVNADYVRNRPAILVADQKVSPFFSHGSIQYSDGHSDAGLALAIGGGFDIRLSTRIGLRAAMDYDPTFLVRPLFPDLTPDAEGRVALRPASSERQRQDHVRLSIGMVWRIR